MESTEKSAGASEQGAIQPHQGTAESSPARQRDLWDKFEILLRPAAAFLTALTVALIGWFGQQALDKRGQEQTLRAQNAEKEITRRTQISENYRLYTQLLSNREEAESALRKDIFSSILKEFLSASDRGGREFIRNRILKLEILALNFGEALSLSPLFVELDKNIREISYDTEFVKLDRADDRKRLEGLAKRVSEQQITALSTGGKSWDFEIPVPRDSEGKPAEVSGSYEWPRDSDGQDFYEETLEGITRNYVFRFSNIDSEYHTVTVELEIQKADQFRTIEQRFKLDFYNFPMVDNTRLSDDQRFTLIMTKFEDKGIHFSAIVFPGKYSSQRDKPFLDDVISRLQSENQKQAAEAPESE